MLGNFTWVRAALGSVLKLSIAIIKASPYISLVSQRSLRVAVLNSHIRRLRAKQ